MRRSILALGIVLVGLAAWAPERGAAGALNTYNVADGDVSGLIAAVTAANGNPGADTINLAAGGTYTLTAAYDADNGLPPIVDSLTINGNGATITRSSAIGTPGFRIFLISTSGTVTLSGLIVSNGRKSGDFQGGAIRNFQGTLNLIGTTLTGNAAAFGGALWNYASGIVNLTNSTISENVSDDPVAGGAGGGIYNYQGVINLLSSTIHANSARSSGGIFHYQGQMTIAGSTISDNFTTAGGNGGGMTVYQSTAAVSNSTWTGNRSMNGGAIYNLGTLSVLNTTLAGNTADLKGGAIFSDTGGTLTVANSTISGNSAHSPSAPTSGYGGGIFNWNGSSATVSNTTIAGNFTNFAGGGIFNNGNLTLTNATIVDNRSTQYASGLASDSGAATTVRNTLLAGNFLGRNCHAFGPTIVSQGHNLSDNGTCTAFGQAGDLNNAAAGLDPAGLTANGGTTQTVGLAPGSAAIDAGDDAICGAAPINGVDQRGEPRPSGPHCDIGAYEAAAADSEAPVIQCAAADGLWHSGDVILQCTASDGGSGLASAGDATFSVSTSVPAGTEADNASTGSRTVCDNAGNCATAAPIGGNKIDRKAPAFTCGATDGLWHAADVSIACTSSDAGSGLAPGSGPSFSLPTFVASGMENANAPTVSQAVCDNAGNCSDAGPIYGNKIDKKAPAITLTTPAATAYVLNASVNAAFSCADGGSGMGACVGTVANGAAVSTSSAGAHSFTVTATDAVGNTATTTRNYTVGYNVCVLYDQTKAHKSGSTIPIKLQLCDASGVNVSSAGVQLVATAVYQVSTNAPGSLEDAGNSNPDDQFRFDVDKYIFNLSLNGFSQGTYALVFTAGSDPTPHTVTFQVK